MKKIICIAILGLALFIMGCPARSLFPLFADEDLVFKSELIGTWVNQNNEAYSFHAAAGQLYEVSMYDKDGTVTVVFARLGQLGKTLFLDSYPAAKVDDYYLLKSHIITRLELSGDTLKIASLEGDYLKAQMGSGKLKIAHALQGDDVILTAATAELQQLVLSLEDIAAAFPDPENCVRRQ